MTCQKAKDGRTLLFDAPSPTGRKPGHPCPAGAAPFKGKREGAHHADIPTNIQSTATHYAAQTVKSLNHADSEWNETQDSRLELLAADSEDRALEGCIAFL